MGPQIQTIETKRQHQKDYFNQLKEQIRLKQQIESHNPLSREILKMNSSGIKGDGKVLREAGMSTLKKQSGPVSYTHLTLPTILLVQISVVALSLQKKTLNQLAGSPTNQKSTLTPCQRR
eukprot:TRINITY_DN20847_c0_g1_i2.p1 TRINITY_DN20847_c0_g1~~TRINITY_DN20847_c0_g1_i2.p1  ORF type:complete len:120 (+),score=18.00 TRINITY_DN20847_c0_g1_i2:178-537(+)